MTFDLVGSYTFVISDHGGTSRNEFVEEIVATFDCEKDAKKYIKNSRLKNPADRKCPFKKRSLLWNCEYAEIRPKPDPDEVPPHNPTI